MILRIPVTRNPLFFTKEYPVTTIIDVITDAVRTGFVLAGYDAELGRVSISNRPDLCDYQSNGAMAGAKQYHKKPIDIANEVVEKLKEMKQGEINLFDKAEAVMPGLSI
jgi:arginyl-tRNA synthetase